jgi:hypothetical protein
MRRDVRVDLAFDVNHSFDNGYRELIRRHGDSSRVNEVKKWATCESATVSGPGVYQPRAGVPVPECPTAAASCRRRSAISFSRSMMRWAPASVMPSLISPASAATWLSSARL